MLKNTTFNKTRAIFSLNVTTVLSKIVGIFNQQNNRLACF